MPSATPAASIRTWVSAEPVIDPEGALRMMAGLADTVGVWKVGKLNQDREREREIDWPDFLRRTLELLTGRGAE